MAKKSFYKIEMLFLKILEKEDCYGYQLTQSIQDITNGQIKIAEGTMYPILYKLQDKGYISDRQVKVGKRQTRVYYHLEPAGKEYLSQLTHDYYQPITMAIEKLRETINTHTKIVGRVKKLESIPDASKRTNGKVTIVYLDENDSKKTVSVQLAKDDYNKAIEAHESGSHVEVIGEIEDNGKRKKLMTAESFSIID